MPLTEQQEAALPALEWLIGGPRRSGRTVALAIAIIRSACRQPGVPFYLIDHHISSADMRDYTRNVIRSLLDVSPLPRNASVRMTRDRITIQAPVPFEWFPNVDSFGSNGPPGPPRFRPEYQGTVNEPSMGTSVAEDFTSRLPIGFGRIMESLSDTILHISDTESERKANPPEPKPALQRIIEDES